MQGARTPDTDEAVVRLCGAGICAASLGNRTEGQGKKRAYASRRQGLDKSCRVALFLSGCMVDKPEKRSMLWA